MTDPLLRLETIDVYYGSFHALRGLNLEVGAGEIVCLLGGNASGKSSTMKTIFGLNRPRAGRVLISGEDVTRLDTPARIRRGIASVPEARRVFADMTVEENLVMGAFTRPRPRRLAPDLDKIYTAFPRLAERRRQHAGTMSGGEQQMLAFGRALMSNPRLICMDEPTMGLSPLFVDRVLEIIDDMRTALGVSVLMVEQNAELALSIADRGYVLATGELVLSGAASELLGSDRVREAYLGKDAAA